MLQTTFPFQSLSPTHLVSFFLSLFSRSIIFLLLQLSLSLTLLGISHSKVSLYRALQHEQSYWNQSLDFILSTSYSLFLFLSLSLSLSLPLSFNIGSDSVHVFWSVIIDVGWFAKYISSHSHSSHLSCLLKDQHLTQFCASISLEIIKQQRSTRKNQLLRTDITL